MTTKQVASAKHNWRRYIRMTGCTRRVIADRTGIPYNRVNDNGRDDKPGSVATRQEVVAVSKLIVVQAKRIRTRVRTLEQRGPMSFDEFKAGRTDFSGIPNPQPISISGRFGMIGSAPPNSDLDAQWAAYRQILEDHKSGKDDKTFDAGVTGAKREFTFLRKALCLTHRELAEMCGHAPDTVRDWGRLSEKQRSPHPDLMREMREKASGWAHQVLRQIEAPQMDGGPGVVSPVLPMDYAGAFKELAFRRVST